MNGVFLDTVGLLARWNASDQWCAAATASFSRIQASRRPLITTSYVLLECGNAASRRSFRREVARTRQALVQAGQAIEPTPGDIDRAWEAYERGVTGGPSIVDCVSFEVMRRLGLTEAFTNDQHFAEAGFRTMF